jgi:hypothetical protein
MCSRWAASPGKIGFTGRSKGAGSPPARVPTRRAGCHESGSSGSTEARRSNPRCAAWSDAARRPRVIPTFYPMGEGAWVSCGLPHSAGRCYPASGMYLLAMDFNVCRIAYAAPSCPVGTGRQGHASSAQAEGGRDVTKRVKILPEGSGPSGSAQLGWRGEPPTWRQAGPTL